MWSICIHRNEYTPTSRQQLHCAQKEIKASAERNIQSSPNTAGTKKVAREKKIGFCSLIDSLEQRAHTTRQNDVSANSVRSVLLHRMYRDVCLAQKYESNWPIKYVLGFWAERNSIAIANDFRFRINATTNRECLTGMTNDGALDSPMPGVTVSIQLFRRPAIHWALDVSGLCR